MTTQSKVARFVGLLLALAAVPGQATVFYVSTQGSDSSSGTAPHPRRTIAHAYSLARPGDTVRMVARALDRFIKKDRLFVIHDNVFYHQDDEVIC